MSYELFLPMCVIKKKLLPLPVFLSPIFHFLLSVFANELKAYINYYNNDRIKAKLREMSPVQYERMQ
jgi:hypothetical protein